MTIYKASFFDNIKNWSRESAQVIVPIILGEIGAKSVVDVGCGQGEWLRVFVENGVTDVLGLDGSYVDMDRLAIRKESFKAVNLPYRESLGRKFDLVVSLEVGEHLLPSDAECFVDMLCKLGDVVLFSAAIPGQGGTFHKNEQWPDYWAQRFASNNFVALDLYRQRFWEDDRIAWFYAQNTVLYVKDDCRAKYGFSHHKTGVTRLVHHKLQEQRRNYVMPTVGAVARRFPSILRDSLKYHLGIKDPR